MLIQVGGLGYAKVWPQLMEVMLHALHGVVQIAKLSGATTGLSPAVAACRRPLT